MFGDSYYGFTQWAAAASGHPALRAIVPRVTSADLGAISIGTWWDEGVRASDGADYFAHYWVDRLIYDYLVDWTHRPLAEAPSTRPSGRSGPRAAAIRHDARAGCPSTITPTGHPFDTVSIPVLHSVGWFDNIMPNSMRDYTTLRSRAASGALAVPRRRRHGP